jgi:hypothetical protein
MVVVVVAPERDTQRRAMEMTLSTPNPTIVKGLAEPQADNPRLAKALAILHEAKQPKIIDTKTSGDVS